MSQLTSTQFRAETDYIPRRTVIYCGDECGVVVIWDAATGRNISFYPDLPIFALAWSPDDTRIVTAFSYTLAKISQAS